jgi:hypothetical protein
VMWISFFCCFKPAEVDFAGIHFYCAWTFHPIINTSIKSTGRCPRSKQGRCIAACFVDFVLTRKLLTHVWLGHDAFHCSTPSSSAGPVMKTAHERLRTLAHIGQQPAPGLAFPRHGIAERAPHEETD